VLIGHLCQFKTVVLLHWCLKRAVEIYRRTKRNDVNVVLTTVSVPVVPDESVPPTPTQVDVVVVGVEGKLDEDEQGPKFFVANFPPKKRLRLGVSF
jgi:hypothetical protein